MKNSIDNPLPPIEKNKENKSETEQLKMWNEFLDYREELKEDIKDKPLSLLHLKKFECAITDRNLFDIYTLYGKEIIDNLKGKTVLDIGCGKSTFAKQLNEDRDLGANVFSFDRAYSPYSVKDSFVVGDTSRVPFKDGSFDEAFATYSMPYWAFDPRQINDFLSESLRILKKGGYLNIHPIDLIENRRLIIDGEDAIEVKTSLARDTLKRLQIHFIDLLEKYKKEGRIDIELHAHKYTKQESPSYAFGSGYNTWARIKKLK